MTVHMILEVLQTCILVPASNSAPVVCKEHNERSGVSGTMCHFERGLPLNEKGEGAQTLTDGRQVKSMPEMKA